MREKGGGGGDVTWFLHGEALASIVVVNPMVSLISRPTAIRFTPALLCLFDRPGRDVLSPSNLFFHNFHPFVRRGGDGDGANGTDRNSGGLGRKAIERRFRRVVARDGRRRMIYLCFLPSPATGIEIEFCG